MLWNHRRGTGPLMDRAIGLAGFGDIDMVRYIQPEEGIAMLIFPWGFVVLTNFGSSRGLCCLIRGHIRWGELVGRRTKGWLPNLLER